MTDNIQPKKTYGKIEKERHLYAHYGNWMLLWADGRREPNCQTIYHGTLVMSKTRFGFSTIYVITSHEDYERYI